MVKANLTKNFHLDTKNQSTRPINFIDSSTNIDANGFIENIGSTKFFSILENITQHLLKSKHALTLGQLFKITSNLRQCVATKLASRRRTITVLRPNPVIALVAIDLHIAMIQVQVGKNMVEDVLLDGGSKMNIMMKELWNRLGFPNPKPTLYTFGMVDQTITKPVGFINDLKIHINRISYITMFIVMKNNVLDYSYSMLLSRPWLHNARVIHDWGNNLITIEGNGMVRTIIVTKI